MQSAAVITRDFTPRMRAAAEAHQYRLRRQLQLRQPAHQVKQTKRTGRQSHNQRRQSEQAGAPISRVDEFAMQTDSKHPTSSASYQSIPCMAELEQQSFEELRWSSAAYQQPKAKYQAQPVDP